MGTTPMAMVMTIMGMTITRTPRRVTAMAMTIIMRMMQATAPVAITRMKAGWSC